MNRFKPYFPQLLILCITLTIWNCSQSDTESGEEQPIETLAEVSTTVATDITENSVTSGGTISDDGGSPINSRGICWSLQQNPTTGDNKTQNGSGTGTFVSKLTGLSPNTQYFIRSYAINNKGTAYGDQVSVTTLGGLPVLTTKEISEITEYTATSGGTISEDGGTPIVSRGICWGTNPNPTIDDSLSAEGEGSGEFTSTLEDLEANTEYFVRAYAINSLGTSYGNELSFTTAEAVPWTGRANFPYNTFYVDSFVIDDILYAGNGFRQFITVPEENLFFKYDPTLDSWEEITSPPWERRSHGISFAINGYGYVGLGQDCSGPPTPTTGSCSTVHHDDLWRYDPSTDSWSEMAKFPGGGRSHAAFFVIGDKAYVTGGGYESVADLLWEYDPATNSWEQKASYPGRCVGRQTGLTIGDKGYVGFGFEGRLGGDLLCSDFWEYSPTTDTWAQKANFPGASRYHTTGIGLNDYGYVGFGTGEEISVFPWTLIHDDIWRYDSVNNEWSLHPVAFPGEGRTHAIAEIIGNKIIWGLGLTGNDAFIDIWEFNPLAN